MDTADIIMIIVKIIIAIIVIVLCVFLFVAKDQIGGHPGMSFEVTKAVAIQNGATTTLNITGKYANGVVRKYTVLTHIPFDDIPVVTDVHGDFLRKVYLFSRGQINERLIFENFNHTIDNISHMYIIHPTHSVA